ncbi:hypothetical protein BUE93_20550 [Chromobacterium amazonense]|uniref:Toxin n=1 Tax=Chromobacterium amazonense TaxID=1382803 RepID=A0A2S9WZE1_9NEIS|nr:SpvB/TcaC N-terminal domain-containing protein [Chromobacterium amazonense]PRP68766.1 hypothetical protein BUE93_20550 [Chromobacterium amazonense]
MQKQTQDKMAVSPLSLPKGGGAIKGMGESLGAVGPTGMASFTLPLPVSAGRGYAPAMALQYSSGAGNGEFGIGWQLPLWRITRRTSLGAPLYDDERDTFLGPDGELLVPERDSNGQVVTRSCEQYGDKALGARYQVTRYFPRVEGAFDRIERWQADAQAPFWMIHGADGQLHCLGKTAQARVEVPDETGQPRIGQWLLEESVSPVGEHQCYHYRAEDAQGVSLTGAEALRERGAWRYLNEVRYGNLSPAKHLYCWDDPLDDGPRWLFRLVLDYGERGLDAAVAPPYAANSDWLTRQDAFSGYEYGYELRCHRLCRQVLMYHQFDEWGDAPMLVSRLLLAYDETPTLSRLTGACQWAYEADGTAQSLPPLEWRYTEFSPPGEDGGDGWQAWQGTPGLDDGQPYQWVDLYGEGLPGLLYRVGADWRYRAPQREAEAASPDAISYGEWTPVSPLPAMQSENTRLMDCNGDGRLEWVVTQPGLAGYFTLHPDRSVSGFTPFTALPSEYFHPQAQWADLMGAGLSDLAMIGPASVRIYANQRTGFAPALTIARDEAQEALPVSGRDAGVLVAFSDVLGSGHQHLLAVSHDGIWCWPNLGRGRFGRRLPLAKLGLDATSFHPQRVFLADIDGSGASDLIYALDDALLIYFNRSGNGFSDPLRLPLPAGVRFDTFCQLNLADVQGQGNSSLILSVPHPQMRHWRYDFSQHKPYLLCGANNNMGRDQEWSYRSSAQFWLDDKATGLASASHLPFPIHVVEQVATEDEISGNRLVQRYRYHHGVYDGEEREFRGFGLVEAEDTSEGASATGSSQTFTPPVFTRTWYHTGGAQDATSLPGAPWQEDASAFALGDTRLTGWNAATASDVPLPVDTDAATLRLMHRALKGRLLRQEVYGRDQTAWQGLPYSVNLSRYQVRLHQPRAGQSAPVVLPLSLETLSTQYERFPTDPQCSQQVVLACNEYGQTTHRVDIHYPRRAKPENGPAPDDLPPTCFASSYDDQQQKLHLSEHKQSYWQLIGETDWQLGLPAESRSNVLIHLADKVPTQGLSFEALSNVDGLLAPEQPRIYGGQEQLFYREHPPRSLPALVDYIARAELDKDALSAYAPVLDDDALTRFLTEAGYKAVEKALPGQGELADTVWVVEHDFVTYRDDLFYLPASRQSTRLNGAVQFAYNRYGLLEHTTDALANRTRVVAYDYRFLTPVQLLDINDNTHQVALDAFGRVIASWYFGTENGNAEPVGFTAPALADCTTSSVEALVAQAAPLTVASRQAWAPASWMGEVSRQLLSPECASSLLTARLLLDEPHAANYRLTAKGRRWLHTGQAGLAPNGFVEVRSLLQKAAVQIPPHGATLTADRYPDAAYYQDGLPQQLQVAVVYGDGFGRTLQTAVRYEPGLAYRREEDGELAVGDDGQLVLVDTPHRWTVSGRVEYDNKGQAIRVFQPYFVDDWRYVADRSLRACGYADLHFYDPLGRENRVETAKGHQRRTRYYPWFHVMEDENDLAE